MTPRLRTAALAALSLLALAAALPASAAVYVYGCVLDARQEVPTNASTASGGGSFIINTDANTVTYRIAYAGLSSAEAAAHIHGNGTSSPGNNAGVLVGLPAGNPKAGVWNYLEAQESMILAGLCYANIHTINNGGGEIRGQIVPFNAQLDAAQEVPVNASTGRGWCTATIDTAANTLSYYVAYSGLTGVPNNAHFHGNQLPGTSAGVKVAIPGFTVSPMIGTVSYLQADEGALLAGRWYVNIHTAANPGGEIRGQLVPMVIPMDDQQEVGLATPAPGSAGYALVSIDTLANTLGYDARVLALSGAETLAHIHGYAQAGVGAGVVATLPAGARKLGTWNYGATDEANVLSGLSYFNIHTAANPGGEIRGQIERLPGSAAVLGVGPGTPRPTSGLLAAPNPTGGRTNLSFQLSRTGLVSLAIVGVDGRLVHQVPEAFYAPGPHSFEWDGVDDQGGSVAPGVYFAKIRTPDGVRSTRIVRLR